METHVHLGRSRGVGLDSTPEFSHSCLQIGQGGWQMLPEVGLQTNNIHQSDSTSLCVCVSAMTSSCAQHYCMDMPIMHCRGKVICISACKGYLLCCACNAICSHVRICYSRKLQEHKHNRDVSTRSQTDVLDTNEGTSLGHVKCSASQLSLTTPYSCGMAKPEHTIAADISHT